jgi:hypothetical protein
LRIKQLVRGVTYKSSLLTLETDAERALSNDDLMRIVDNAEGIKYDPKADSYALTGGSFGPDRFFGGKVELDAVNADRKTVTVYID